MSTPNPRLAALTLAAMGVVYGDIGTSPLYAFKEAFVDEHGLGVSPDNIFGVLSLMVWSLLLIVSGKYISIVMRADNNGEGGIMALMALALRRAKGRVETHAVLIAGLIGAALFYGDGVITPAISVLSAMEGMEVATPLLKPYVLPAAILVLTLLFYFQRHGTERVGVLFGPIMLLWFVALGWLGARQIGLHPEVLAALDPRHAVAFFARQPFIAFVALGAVVLVLTGGEALYADMGHFGRRPIRLAWFGLVLPCLLLNYFGQGALLIADPAAAVNPFYILAPEGFLIPLLVLATLATVIASQAVISGAFSITQQAMQLGYAPRMDVQHTSTTERGQIYLPGTNWTLFLAVVAVTAGFGSSTHLAAAYGIAVTGTMAITGLLLFVVAYRVWRVPLWVCLGIGVLFLIVDLAFFGANLLKIWHGGWFPLVFGLVVFGLMVTWHQGRWLLHERLIHESMGLDPFLASLALSGSVTRVPGVAVFLTQHPRQVPHALLHNLKHNKILHEQVALLAVRVLDVPRVDHAQRVRVEALDAGFWRIEMCFGFKESPNVPRYLPLCADLGIDIDPESASFFLGKETLVPAPHSEMSLWRRRLFIAAKRNARSAGHYFRLPPNRVVELGAVVTI